VIPERFRTTAVGLVVAAALALPAQGGAAQYVYPLKGQGPKTQANDEHHCSQWARNQSGYDPYAPPPPTAVAAPVTGSGARARGAAGGAIIGAVAGNAGAGAAAGAVAGGLHRRIRNQQNADTQNAANADYVRHQQAAYNRARAACLEGRGYSVR
jgi:hypothetical protein